MKKKLYYTVEKEVDNTGESLTGNKEVMVYEIINSEPKKFFSLDLTLEDNTEKEIQNYRRSANMKRWGFDATTYPYRTTLT